MSIHGIVSTYFGDLEYDLGKSLTWTQYFCDSVYVMDVNTADASRQYVVDWDKQTPNAKYSFATDVRYFGSPSRAASWRQESFRRAKAAWNYKDDDWVLFVDGTEALNVYHAPPVSVEVSDVSIDAASGNMTFTLVESSDIAAGDRVTVTGAFIDFPGLSDSDLLYGQVEPQDAWTISHNFHLFPTITELSTDPEYSILDVVVTHLDRDTVEIRFPEPVAGDVTVSIAAVPAGYVSLDGEYEVLSSDGDTFTVPPNFAVATGVAPDRTTEAMSYDDALVANASAVYSTEPAAFHSGDLFQSWLYDEIDTALEGGKTRISLDGWAMIRSSSPEEVEFKSLMPELLVDDNNEIAIPGARVDNSGDVLNVWVSHPKCYEYYLPMNRLVRLVKVSTLSDPYFDWQSLDQADPDPADAHPASRLSLISYAYIRWGENPAYMTQSVDSSLPNYVSGNEFYPPLRPTTVENDVGFAMRRLISTVRPVAGAPTEWSAQDAPGEQPMIGDYEQLDTLWLEQETPTVSLVNDEVEVSTSFTGYKQYGGTPLYPGVIRANLREGVWYVKNSTSPIMLKVASISYSPPSGLVTVNTTKEHPFRISDRVSVYGTDHRGLDGQYEVFSVPSITSFTVKRPGLGAGISTTPTPLAGAVKIPPSLGPIPWNYLLNSLGIVTDPREWVQSGAKKNP